MARFGQSFLASLTQPSYGQGLFELGGTIGQAPAAAAERSRRESMMEQLQNMTPLETADYMVTQARTPEQLVTAKAARDTALSQAGKQSIDTIQSQLLAETDPERMKQLEDAMVSVAQQTGNTAAQYRGSASKVLEARDKAAWETTKRNNEKTALVEGRMVDLAVSQMIKNGASDVPKTMITPNGEVAVPENLRDDIQKEFVARKKTDEEFKAALEGDPLPESYINFINENPELLEDNAQLQAAVKTIEATNGKGSSVARTNAIKVLTTLVDNEQKTTRENKRSDKALEMDVNSLVEQIVTSEDRTYWWEGDSMRDFLDGGGTEEEIKTFREQAVQTLKENPNASPQEVIDSGMTGMRRKIPAQSKQEAREEKTRSQAERISAIEASVKQANPNLTDAQVKAVVQNKLQEMQIEALGRQAQTSRAFQ